MSGVSRGAGCVATASVGCRSRRRRRPAPAARPPRAVQSLYNSPRLPRPRTVNYIANIYSQTKPLLISEWFFYSGQQSGASSVEPVCRSPSARWWAKFEISFRLPTCPCHLQFRLACVLLGGLPTAVTRSLPSRAAVSVPEVGASSLPRARPHPINLHLASGHWCPTRPSNASLFASVEVSRQYLRCHFNPYDNGTPVEYVISSHASAKPIVRTALPDRWFTFFIVQYIVVIFLRPYVRNSNSLKTDVIFAFSVLTISASDLDTTMEIVKDILPKLIDVSSSQFSFVIY